MSSIHCYTSISFSYLSRARVLAETVRKYHPDWTLWICISDREPDGFTFELEDEQFDHVLWADEFGIPELRSWMFKHNVVEMCTAVKGLALNQNPRCRCRYGRLSGSRYRLIQWTSTSSQACVFSFAHAAPY